MLRALFRNANALRRRISQSYGTSISTPRGRFTTLLHYYLSDVGFLRVLWTNQFEIAPGVWRSNQPSPRRIKKLKKLGIKTILNLRGTHAQSFHILENEACGRHRITLINQKFSARYLAPRQQFLDLFDAFDQAEKPLLMHCKSGADRAGLAAALWLMDQEGANLNEARKMLSFKYLHVKTSDTGIQDQVLDCYAQDISNHPIPIRDWFATRYDPDQITAHFDAKMNRPSKAAAE